MLYLSEEDIDNIDISWGELAVAIKRACKQQAIGDFSQPLKPYLRFKDPKNRIIAMPAYLGGEESIAGIKWIASFPDNIKRGTRRAHSIVILNDIDTGRPVCIINSSKLSVIRTAAVSAAILTRYIENFNQKQFTVGIIGLGPIGRAHADMCRSILGSQLKEIRWYDLNDELDDVEDLVRDKEWASVFEKSDICITTTVSSAPYINTTLKSEKLILNVSLRDFCDEFMEEYSGTVIVDNWEEVCRENTDIHRFYKVGLVSEANVLELHKYLLNAEKLSNIFVNPMGMAIYDMAIANIYHKFATSNKRGSELND